MPSQRMNSGTQAIDGIARKRLQARIEQTPHHGRIAGRRADQRWRRPPRCQSRPRPAPKRHQRIALQFAAAREIDEVRQRSRTAAAPGARSPSPCRTTNSHASASVTGRTSPSAGRVSRAQRIPAARSRAGLPSSAPWLAPWAAMVMPTRDMVQSANAITPPAAPASFRSPRAWRRGSVKRLRRRDEAVVDQIVERFFHVDIGWDHAGLLQR